jgi:hypothetical protein
VTTKSRRKVGGCQTTIALLILVEACSMAAQAGGHLDRVMSGRLVGLRDNSISVRNDRETRTFQVGKNTRIWRGHLVDVHQLHLGDEIDLRYRMVTDIGDAIATAIWANIDRWAGTITKVLTDRVEIARVDEHGDSDGQATILLNRYTLFNEGTRKDIQVGRFLEVIGLKLDANCIEATRVLHILGQ